MAVAWQYSSKGWVNGISVPVDLDVDFDGVVNLAAPERKTNLQIAQEVKQGLWGNKYSRPSRCQRLTEAGYDYYAIQHIVNNMMK